MPNGLAPGVDIYAERPCVTWESLGLRTMFGLDAGSRRPAAQVRERRAGNINESGEPT